VGWRQGEGTVMTPDEMEALIEAHLRAEGNGDPEGAVANYTEDIENDVVGFPGSPLRGIPAALGTGSWSKMSAPTAKNVCTPTMPTTR
jgi:hypothetical protein